MGIVIQEGLEVDASTIPERGTLIVRISPLNVTEEISEILNGIAEKEYRSLLSVTRMLLEYGLKYLDDPETPRIEIPERSGGIIRIGPVHAPLELRDTLEQMADKDFRSVSSVARQLIEYGLAYREWLRVRQE